MALPAPNLDDRRFQDLVDDAKRLVQQRCPEWTDHNVSDPGVTLIELFAWMTDQLLYRLNRVPDRNYVKFLELIGVRLFPPTAARAPVTFWLSAPQPDVVRIAAGDPGRDACGPRPTRRSSSPRSRTWRSCPAPSARPRLDRRGQDVPGPHRRPSTRAPGFFCFDTPPKPGDALMVGLTDAVPVVRGQPPDRGHIEGVGVDPDRRRSSGRPGTATAGARASSTATRPAASTATATSSSTCRPAT